MNLPILYSRSQVEDLVRDYHSLAEAVICLLDSSEVLYRSAWAASVMVFRINKNIVVKAGHEDYAITKHQTLKFLEEHMPSFPAPRPHGLIRLGIHRFLFTSHMPGVTLRESMATARPSPKTGRLLSGRHTA